MSYNPAQPRNAGRFAETATPADQRASAPPPVLDPNTIAGRRHHAVAGHVRIGSKEMGYTLQDFHDPDTARPIGLSLRTGFVAAHRTDGRKYGLSAPGHHWSGIAERLTASDKMPEVIDIAERTLAFSDTMQFDGKPAWASMLMDTVNEVAVVQLRSDRPGPRGDWRTGTKVRLHRNPEGDWQVVSTHSGYINHIANGLITVNDDPFHNHRVTETVEWFHRNLNYWNGTPR